MKYLKSFGRILITAIITAVLLYLLASERLIRDQIFFDAGRQYERGQAITTGNTLPNGVMETGYPNLTYRYRDSAK